MTDEEFIQMVHELVRKEEQRLCLNSELFFRRSQRDYGIN